MPEYTSDELARLADYFAGALTPNEVVETERWIDSHPSRRKFVERLRLSRLHLEPITEDHLNLQSRMEGLVQNLSTLRHPVQRRTPLLSLPWHRFRWYGLSTGIAALCVLIIGLSFFVRSDQTTMKSIYTTGNGERAAITLPDGSTVLLNVASQLEVPINYGRTIRDVRLRGEAFFTVKSHQGTPFVVTSGPSVTKVLGTRFSVRHYDDDTVATVAVKTGKVAVDDVILTEHRSITVTQSGTSHVTAAMPHHFNFARGVLAFQYRPLVEAIPDLNRWYNADIRLGDAELADRELVGAFETGSLTDLKSILELTFGLRVVRGEGRVLTLYLGR